MRKKRILVISGGIWPPAVEMAGTSAIYNLLKYLAHKEKELDIHILTSTASWTDSDFRSWSRQEEKKHNLKFHFVKGDFFESLSFLNLVLTRISLFLKAINLNRRLKVNLIHDYSSLPFLIGFTGLLGKICRCQTIHTLCTVNSRPIGSTSLIFGLRWIDKIICVGNQVKEKLLYATRRQIEREKIIYIPLGVNTKRFKPSCKDKFLLKKLNISKDSRVILFIGPLEDRKGAFILANAVKKIVALFPKAMFIFVSYGKEGRDPHFVYNKRRLEKILIKFKNNVLFLEGKQNISRLMSIADIFVLPATSPHGTLAQPITLLEAMSMGKACVVSDIQEGDGLVEHRVNCLLFKSGDVKDLAKKLLLLLSNENLAKKLGRKARKKIIADFSIEKVAKKLYIIYNSMNT